MKFNSITTVCILVIIAFTCMCSFNTVEAEPQWQKDWGDIIIKPDGANTFRCPVKDGTQRCKFEIVDPPPGA